jgi:Cu(I)/Ag(I) efflux system membrane fusion protein
MELEPIYAADVESTRAGELPVASKVVRVSPERQQMLGVRLGRAERSRVTGTLRALGRIALDETRVFPMIAGGDGWVTTIAPGSTTGSTVRKGQPLVSVYGRDYVTAQRSFLYAMQASEHPAPGPSDLQAQTSLTLREAKLVLQNLGLGPDQIDELARTHDVLAETTLTAPASGVILARGVYDNQRFDRGAQLFRVADLHHVWVLADLTRDDQALVRPGDQATLVVANRTGLRFRATVAAALPPFDSGSRTFKVRLEVDNPELILRPDMFVDVEFSLTLQEAVTVPADAVIESGRQKVVFVDLGAGHFEPRSVETGSRLGDRIQILRGLTAGESIAVSGNFLLDSESRMHSGSSGGHD